LHLTTIQYSKYEFIMGARYPNLRHQNLRRKETNTRKQLNFREGIFTYHLHKNFSMLVVNVDLGTAPIMASFFSPLLKIITVGMLLIP